MWSYGPSFDLGFDTDTDYSDVSSEELSDDDSLNSRALSPDSRALRTPRGGRLRLLDATQRLQALYDNESGDAHPEWAINSSNDSYESSAEELRSPEASPIREPFSTPLFMPEGVNAPTAPSPVERTPAQLWRLSLVQRELARVLPHHPVVRRRITPRTVPRSSSEDKEDDGSDAKTGPG